MIVLFGLFFLLYFTVTSIYCHSLRLRLIKRRFGIWDRDIFGWEEVDSWLREMICLEWQNGWWEDREKRGYNIKRNIR